MENIKVSIIMPVYNAGKTLRRALESVRYQTSSDYELIVVDGQSTDDTCQIVKSYKDIVSVFISEKDEGYSDALNKGIRMATGDYTIILAGDDFFLPNAMETIAGSVKADTDVWCGNMLVAKQYGGIITRFKRADHPAQLKNGSYMAHPATAFRRGAFERYGYYNPHYKINADAELILRMYEQGAVFQVVDEYITVFVCGGMSVKEDEGDSLKQIRATSQVEEVSIRYGMSQGRAQRIRVGRIIKKKISTTAKRLFANSGVLRILYTLDGQKPLSKNEIRQMGIPDRFIDSLESGFFHE